MSKMFSNSNMKVALIALVVYVGLQFTGFGDAIAARLRGVE